MPPLPELDINLIAVEFINSKIDGFFTAGKMVLKGANEKIMLMMRSTYSDYLKTIWERHARSKSFFSKTNLSRFMNFMCQWV